jgi:hypothetical protein
MSDIIKKCYNKYVNDINFFNNNIDDIMHNFDTGLKIQNIASMEKWLDYEKNIFKKYASKKDIENGFDYWLSISYS